MNPLSATFGAEQRTNIIYNALKKIDLEIDIAYIGDHAIDDKNRIGRNFFDFSKKHGKKSKLSTLRSLFLLDMFPEDKMLSAEISKLLETNHYDYIFCRYLPYAAKCGLSKSANKLILDIDDMPEQALQIDFSKKTGLKKLYFSLLQKAYRRDTVKWIRNCKQCYVPNNKQAERYGIGYLPNISSVWSDCKDNSPNNLLFIGKLDWKPNYDGLIHFLDNCWESIHAKLPHLKLYIGGKGLESKLSRELDAKYPGTEFMGFVDDLVDFYKLGSIVICPIYSGAGTNIKIVEALSMRKTLIASQKSTKGYERFLKNGINCLIADNDQQFIADIVRAVTDSEFSHELASNGYKDVSALYSIEYIETILSNDI